VNLILKNVNLLHILNALLLNILNFYVNIVTIVGNAEYPVSGFMVQARDRSNAELLGTFEVVPQKVSLVNCFNGTAVCLISCDS
jgi:hypothetical protein